MVTSSVSASARPMSSILQSHVPSAAATPGATTLDLVNQVGDMLKQQKIDLLTEVTNIVESRLPSQPCVPKLPPSHQHPLTSPIMNQEYDDQEYDEDRFHRHHRSMSQRRSHESHGSFWKDDKVKLTKGFKLIMDAKTPDVFDGKSRAQYCHGMTP